MKSCFDPFTVKPTNLWTQEICEQCDAPCETISHIFYECPAVKIFWEKATDWWNHKRSENINPNPTEVLYGYKPESNSFHTFNHYLLIARYYVYLARNKFETSELEVFIVLLEIKIQCEREIAITNENLNKINTEMDHAVHFWLVLIYSNLANIFLFVLLVVVNLLNFHI